MISASRTFAFRVLLGSSVTKLVQNASPACRNVHSVTRSTQTTWCRTQVLKRLAHHIHRNNVESSAENDSIVKQWTTPLQFNEPEFDIEFLLDPNNYASIKQNIVDRKGVGDIDLVIELWKKMTDEENEEEKTKLKEKLLTAAREIPNMSHPKSPIGEEDQAKQVELIGNKTEFTFQPRTVVDLGENLGMLRTNNVNLTTGNGTYYFIDKLALLEQALIKYTVKKLLTKGFDLVSVPDLLDPQVIESCGFKTTGDVAQVYKLDSNRHRALCLAGTSEMSLAGYFKDEVLEEKDLPMRLMAVSRCYRAETSSVDQESGIYRVHQFSKVEMFGVTANNTGEESEELLQELMTIQKNLFSQLGLHCRVLDMPTTELGAPAHRKFDVETWMPAKEFWGEISSASDCTDYQSRRLNIKYRTESGDLKHCSTVNGTACAVPRTIMAICESCQQEDGSIWLPDVLWDYMDGNIAKSSGAPKMTWIKNNKLKKL